MVRPSPVTDSRSTVRGGSILRGCLWLILGTFLILFMLACFFLGCDHLWRTDVVKAKIHYTATDPDSQLTDVHFYAGGDKTSSPYMVAGETESVILLPSKDRAVSQAPCHRTVIALQYKLDGKRYDWDGMLFPGGKGYRIELTIDAEGAVTYRCCILPCKLDAKDSGPDRKCATRLRVPAWDKDHPYCCAEPCPPAME